MARILAYTSPAIGHLFHMTPLLLELRARGHDVHLRTAASRVELMRDLGSHTDAIDPAIPAMIHPDWEASNPKQALEVAISTILRARRDRRSRLPEGPRRGRPGHGSRRHQCLGRPQRGRGVGRSVDRVQPLHAADQLRRRVLPPRSADARHDVRTVRVPHDDWGDRIRMIGALPWDPPAERPPSLERRPAHRPGHDLLRVPGRLGLRRSRGGPRPGGPRRVARRALHGGRDHAGRRPGPG